MAEKAASLADQSLPDFLSDLLRPILRQYLEEAAQRLLASMRQPKAPPPEHPKRGKH